MTVCEDGGGCFSPTASTTQAAFTLPEEGLFSINVRLTDAAGNTTAVPATTAVGYDATAPAAPGLGTPTNPAGDGNFEVAADSSSDPGPAPIVGYVGEACPADGGDCEPVGSVGVPPTRATTFLPRGGTWTFTVRALDASGNTSPSASKTIDYAERVPPTATPTPGVSATATQAPTRAPSLSPTPTPTATPRPKPKVKLTKTRLRKRYVDVRGVASRSINGTVTITVRARGRTVTKTAAIRNGKFATRVRLKRRQWGVKRLRVTARLRG